MAEKSLLSWFTSWLTQCQNLKPCFSATNNVLAKYIILQMKLKNEINPEILQEFGQNKQKKT